MAPSKKVFVGDYLLKMKELCSCTLVIFKCNKNALLFTYTLSHISTFYYIIPQRSASFVYLIFIEFNLSENDWKSERDQSEYLIW